MASSGGNFPYVAESLREKIEGFLGMITFLGITIKVQSKEKFDERKKDVRCD